MPWKAESAIKVSALASVLVLYPSLPNGYPISRTGTAQTGGGLTGGSAAGRWSQGERSRVIYGIHGARRLLLDGSFTRCLPYVSLKSLETYRFNLVIAPDCFFVHRSPPREIAGKVCGWLRHIRDQMHSRRVRDEGVLGCSDAGFKDTHLGAPFALSWFTDSP